MKKLTLWYPQQRTSYIIYSPEGVEIGPTLGANEVYCDLCNATVPLNPAPMVDESYVLCLDCLDAAVPNWRQQVTPLLILMWEQQMQEWRASLHRK